MNVVEFRSTQCSPGGVTSGSGDDTVAAPFYVDNI
jgi:hypothetical protein